MVCELGLCIIVVYFIVDVMLLFVCEVYEVVCIGDVLLLVSYFDVVVLLVVVW